MYCNQNFLYTASCWSPASSCTSLIHVSELASCSPFYLHPGRTLPEVHICARPALFASSRWNYHYPLVCQKSIRTYSTSRGMGMALPYPAYCLQNAPKHNTAILVGLDHTWPVGVYVCVCPSGAHTGTHIHKNHAEILTEAVLKFVESVTGWSSCN